MKRYAAAIPQSERGTRGGDRPGGRFADGAQLGSIGASTEGQRRRLAGIVEETAARDGWPEGPGPVLEMLGLTDSEPDPLRAVACPTCSAAAGAPCTGHHGGPLADGEVHAGRRRLVKDPAPEPARRHVDRSVTCPLCGAKPGARCMSRNGHSLPEAHAVRARAAKELTTS